MNIKRLLLLTILLFSIGLFVPKTSHAVDLQEMLTSENSIITRMQEGIEYFLAFKVEKKVDVLEKHAEKRLTMAEGYAKDGNNVRVQSLMQSYLQIKENQNNLLEKDSSENVVSAVEKRTIEQQKTMEKIKTKIDEDGKQKVVKIQEQVVNQVAQKIIEVNGLEGQTEFFNKIEHVWAPGTGPGGEAGTTFAPGTSGTGSGGTTIEGGGTQFAPGTSGSGQGGVIVEGGTIQFAPGTSAGGVGGTVYEGGSGNQFAPGTSAGGSAGSDIKNVDVKTAGGNSGGTNVVESGNQKVAPGTTSGGNVNTTVNRIDPGEGGSLAPGTTLKGKNELAP